MPSPLKPYAENQHPYHLFTGPGCTGLDDTDSVLEESGAQFFDRSTLSASNSATPRPHAFSEESNILIQTIHARGRASRAFREAQESHVGNRTLSQLPTATHPCIRLRHISRCRRGESLITMSHNRNTNSQDALQLKPYTI